MLLDDPLVEYLDEGGKITPGFRSRRDAPLTIPDVNYSPYITQADNETMEVPEIQEPNVGAMTEQEYNRYVIERDQVGGGNTGYQDYAYNSYNDLSYSASPYGYGGAFSTMDDIPDLDVGAPQFGNPDYVGR